MLHAFGHRLITEAPPASAIFLDFFTLQGEDRVRVLFKTDAESEDVLFSDMNMTLGEF